MIPQTTLWTFPTQVMIPMTAPLLKPVNDIPLTKELLIRVLNDLSDRLYRSFRRQVRLVVHGGAVMVLHPSLNHRESTQDIDYVHRSFVSEYRALGYSDAEERLRKCIAETALKYNLGADWINDHADVALPMAYDQQVRTYDPIFYAATRPQNAEPQTIFNGRGLALVAVPWPWAMALKLVRYEKKDPDDCAAIIRLGFAQRGIRWTVAGLEQWISDRCWPMGYSNYQPPQKAQLRQRIQDAIARAFPPSPQGPYMTSPAGHRPPQRTTSETALYFL